MLIKDRRDFFSGLVLLFFGLGALIIASAYRFGTAFRMGPGYFPIVLASLLVVIGIVVTLKSIKASVMEMPRIAWRPLIIVSASVLIFGLIINGAGLALSTFAMTIASRVARPGYHWGETFLLGIALAMLCAGIFYFGLHIQMPLFPTWWG